MGAGFKITVGEKVRAKGATKGATEGVTSDALQALPDDAAYVLVFDTSNEVIALGLGVLLPQTQEIVLQATSQVAAYRASNTRLLPLIDALLQENGITKESIACVACGRGPGSFTGVRICMATAKGIASALEVPLWGISTLDAIAWQTHDAGVRGTLAVVGDAMRKEVYPVRYEVSDQGIKRLEVDRVMKAELAAETLAQSARTGTEETPLMLAGDALLKFSELFAPLGTFVDEALWAPTGTGLLLAVQDAWQKGDIDPFNVHAGNPALALPVYTRLSDAEENERIRLSKNEPKNLLTGVQEEGLRRDQRPQARDSAIVNAQANEQGIVYRPLDAACANHVALLEKTLMGDDAWSEALVLDELPRKDRVWWAAFAENPPEAPAESSLESPSESSCESSSATRLVGYAGGWIIDGQLQILKVATVPDFRRKGIARRLLGLLAADARDLGAQSTSLEVRASNEEAQAFYRFLDFKETGKRPRYYSGFEDALIMGGALPLIAHTQQGGGSALGADYKENLSSTEIPSTAAQKASAPLQAPLILAIETSCDETAAAVVDGAGTLMADVVASQIDFHARFGGVVPEIASRKHIEAICGVAQESLETAAANLGLATLRWRDLDAVAVTYAPGLVGALVVGVAFAKGAAWAAGIPFIGVNHLEGHIYANKIATPDITPPLVVSLVSGGHTMLVFVKDWGIYETLGATLDDAVGEAFDKVAKVMGLGYPGGPAISKIAASGNPRAVDFPRAMLHSGDLRFSLSGLKTAVVTYIHAEEAAGRRVNKADVAASFQQAVIDVQVAKAEKALLQTGAKEFCLGGGVAANKALREAYEQMCARIGVRLTLPPLHACTDNAGMIALVALDRFRAKKFFGLDADAFAHTNLDDAY